MKFTYTKECNLTIGQKLFGIIPVTIYTYDGVYPITVKYINWNTEEIDFSIDQPCGTVSCSFHELDRYVFETREEAETKMSTLEFGDGMNVGGSYY